MTKESLIGISKKLVFRETFNSEFDTRKNGGVPSNVIYENGVSKSNGSTSKITYTTMDLGLVHSIRFKVLFNDNDVTYHGMCGQSVPGKYDGVRFSPVCGFQYTINTIRYGSSTKIDANTWSEIIITRNERNLNIYIDGELRGNYSISVGDNIPLIINTLLNKRNGGYVLNGEMDLFEIYQGELTAGEVKLLYNNKTYQKPVITETIKNNVINNGTFESDTGWSKGSGWTISGGKANANTSGVSDLSQSSVLTIGKTYRITYDVVEYTSGSVEFYNSTGVPIIQRYATGTYSQDFTATGISVYFTARNNFVGAIDNVVIREITPPSLLLDFDSSNNQLIERTGKSMSASNVTLVRTGKYTGAYFNNTSTLTFTGGIYPQADSTTLIWFNADNYGTAIGTEFLGAKLITDLGNFYLAIRENNKTYRCTNGGGYLIGAVNMVYLKRWTFLAFVRKADKTLKVYVGNLDKAPFLADTHSDIGAIGVSTSIRLGTQYKGLIKMAQVYSGELGLAEITQVYMNTKERVV